MNKEVAFSSSFGGLQKFQGDFFDKPPKIILLFDNKQNFKNL